MAVNHKRIAISGTYSTGKTTTAEALARYTGLPRTQAKTMREIVPEVYPGKMLEECNRKELSELGLIRFRERLINESKLDTSYISDGSCLHEWVYGMGRLTYGMNPNDSILKSMLVSVVGFRFRSKARDFLRIYGTAAKLHARKEYSVFVHLPVEFPMVNDGHRPVSDKFRNHTDNLLKETLDEIGLPYFEAKGSIKERLETITSTLKLPTVMDLDQAIEEAETFVAENTYQIEELRRRQQEELKKRRDNFFLNAVHTKGTVQ